MAGVEGNLLQPRGVPPDRLGIGARFEREYDQRALHRVAVDDPLGPRQPQCGVIAKQSRLSDRAEFGIAGRVNCDALAKDVPAQVVAASGRLERGRGCHDGADHHLVQGERAGLVRADGRYRAQRLDRRQAADDRVALRHPLDADGERDRHHGGEAFWNGGDRHADRGHERLLDFVAARHDREHADAGGDGQNHDRQAPREIVHLAQERRGQRFDAPDHAADAAKLGRGAGRHHKSCALAARDQRAGIGHRGAIAEGGVESHRIGRLVRRRRFTGQRCFLDPEVRGAQEPEVGGKSGRRLQSARRRRPRGSRPGR